MGHRSRTEIFLASLGVPARTIQRLFRGLARFETAPSAPEEEIVHDAVRLEAMGAYGIARSLTEGYRERLDIPEMADAIEEAARAPLSTDEGRALAEERRTLMLEFAERLRKEHAELGAAPDHRFGLGFGLASIVRVGPPTLARPPLLAGARGALPLQAPLAVPEPAAPFLDPLPALGPQAHEALPLLGLQDLLHVELHEGELLLQFRPGLFPRLDP